MFENNRPMAQVIHLTVTPANVGSLCADIRALARQGVARIVYAADRDAIWDAAAIELWRREHARLATWIIGARSAGQKTPELPAWRAIEDRLMRGTSAVPPELDGASAEVLVAAQVAAVQEVCAANGRRGRARPAHPLATAAMLAATVTGMAACGSNGAMNARPEAGSDTNQTRDVGIGGGICAAQIDRDALAPAEVLPMGAGDTRDGGASMDGDQVDAEDAYMPAGGVCPAPIGGIC